MVDIEQIVLKKIIGEEENKDSLKVFLSNYATRYLLTVLKEKPMSDETLSKRIVADFGGYPGFMSYHIVDLLSTGYILEKRGEYVLGKISNDYMSCVPEASLENLVKRAKLASLKFKYSVLADSTPQKWIKRRGEK